MLLDRRLGQVVEQRGEVGGLPGVRRRSASTDSSTCSRLLAGSGSRPSRRSSSDTAALSAARADSGSVSQRSERRSSDESTCSSSPALVTERLLIGRTCLTYADMGI